VNAAAKRGKVLRRGGSSLKEGVKHQGGVGRRTKNRKKKENGGRPRRDRKKKREGHSGQIFVASMKKRSSGGVKKKAD